MKSFSDYGGRQGQTKCSKFTRTTWSMNNNDPLPYLDGTVNNMADISKDVIPAKKRRTEASTDLCDKVLQLEQDLCCNLDSLNFSTPVTHVYNPLKYAKETHEDYMRKFCKVGQKVLFLGMNPGPFGMAQNGVSKNNSHMFNASLLISQNLNSG